MINRLVLILALFACSNAGAAIITSTIGNDSPGFAEGSTPTILDLVAAQSGQPAPFDSGKGNDLFSNLSESWTHSFGAIVDNIVSASFRLGIADHDSATIGSQVGSFMADGLDHTGLLDTAFESAGGANNEYNVYEVMLGAADFLNLADGSFTLDLVLSGPTESCSIFDPNDCILNNFNGAFLIFSQLVIETGPPPNPMPEPGMLLLFGTGLLLVARRHRKYH